MACLDQVIRVHQPTFIPLEPQSLIFCLYVPVGLFIQSPWQTNLLLSYLRESFVFGRGLIERKGDHFVFCGERSYIFTMEEAVDLISGLVAGFSLHYFSWKGMMKCYWKDDSFQNEYVKFAVNSESKTITFTHTKKSEERKWKTEVQVKIPV